MMVIAARCIIKLKRSLDDIKDDEIGIFFYIVNPKRVDLAELKVAEARSSPLTLCLHCSL